MAVSSPANYKRWDIILFSKRYLYNIRKTGSKKLWSEIVKKGGLIFATCGEACFNIKPQFQRKEYYFFLLFLSLAIETNTPFQTNRAIEYDGSGLMMLMAPGATLSLALPCIGVSLTPFVFRLISKTISLRRGGEGGGGIGCHKTCCKRFCAVVEFFPICILF